CVYAIDSPPHVRDGSPSPRTSICFCQPYGVRRGRRSFPTRRSSDLHSLAGRMAPYSEARSSQPLSPPRCHGGLKGWDDQASEYRSEEHTSELQSRENLVCRLLLEKKKKSTRTATHTQELCCKSRTTL